MGATNERLVEVEEALGKNAGRRGPGPANIIRRPISLPPMVNIQRGEEPIDEHLRDELAKIEEQIG